MVDEHVLDLAGSLHPQRMDPVTGDEAARGQAALNSTGIEHRLERCRRHRGFADADNGPLKDQPRRDGRTMRLDRDQELRSLERQTATKPQAAVLPFGAPSRW